MPHKCMLQWLHSGLVSFLNQEQEGLQIRLEGLMMAKLDQILKGRILKLIRDIIPDVFKYQD